MHRNPNPFLLVTAYCFMSSSIVLIVLTIFDWKIVPMHAGTQIYCMVCWLLFCFSGVYWWPDIMLTTMNIRHCILEEEQLLLPCLQELQDKTGDQTSYKLFILEEDGPAAFAMGRRTIVLSRGLITLLTKPELIAAMAHEMGHLRSADGVTGAAFAVALFITVKIRTAAGYVLQVLRRVYRPRSYYDGYIPFSEFKRAAAGIVVLFLILAVFHLLHYLFAILFILLLLTLLDKFFLFLWKWNARLNEYRQDAFARELGYGLDLKEALLKIIKSLPPQPVNLYTVLTYHSHPVIYNRIRRLEMLEGLR